MGDVKAVSSFPPKPKFPSRRQYTKGGRRQESPTIHIQRLGIRLNSTPIWSPINVHPPSQPVNSHSKSRRIKQKFNLKEVPDLTTYISDVVTPLPVNHDDLNLHRSATSLSFSSTSHLKQVPLPHVSEQRMSKSPRSAKRVPIHGERYVLTPSSQERKLIPSVSPSPVPFIPVAGATKWGHLTQKERILVEQEARKRGRTMKRTSEIMSHRVDRRYYMTGNHFSLSGKYDISQEELELLRKQSEERASSARTSSEQWNINQSINDCINNTQQRRSSDILSYVEGSEHIKKAKSWATSYLPPLQINKEDEVTVADDTKFEAEKLPSFLSNSSMSGSTVPNSTCEHTVLVSALDAPYILKTRNSLEEISEAILMAWEIRDGQLTRQYGFRSKEVPNLDFNWSEELIVAPTPHKDEDDGTPPCSRVVFVNYPLVHTTKVSPSILTSKPKPRTSQNNVISFNICKPIQKRMPISFNPYKPIRKRILMVRGKKCRMDQPCVVATLKRTGHRRKTFEERHKLIKLPLIEDWKKIFNISNNLETSVKKSQRVQEHVLPVLPPLKGKRLC